MILSWGSVTTLTFDSNFRRYGRNEFPPKTALPPPSHRGPLTHGDDMQTVLSITAILTLRHKLTATAESSGKSGLDTAYALFTNGRPPRPIRCPPAAKLAGPEFRSYGTPFSASIRVRFP